ncbi:MAG: ribosome silencing factor [Clostridia bacterium]|nr:ribosome silencing factor [Clostridia bacterium]
MDKILAREIAEMAVKALDDKKAFDIKMLDVGNQTVIADYFVIACGSNYTQVNALADEVEYKLGEAGHPSTRREGRNGADWVVIDYDSVLVHVFSRDTRAKFNLEKLWADADDIDLSKLLS